MFGIPDQGQLTLGELISWLREQDAIRVVHDGFDDPHSDRGDYSELAFRPATDITIRQMLAAAQSAVGATFTGWKGGEFRMDESTPVYIGRYGDCGKPISEVTLKVWLGKDSTTLKAENDRLRAMLAEREETDHANDR